ncbi:MAG: DUF115 domain-containing protein [Lentisphaerae bacterium]|nr:DUF115 domain-containing protein [Lentisphaerota bacterium]
MTSLPPVSSYEQDIQAFHARVFELLSRAVTPGPPPAPGPLFPPDRLPNLLIFLGTAVPAHFASIRAQLPAASFLFWLYPSCAMEEETAFLRAIPAGSRSLACPLRPDSLYLDKLSLLIALLPEKQVNFVASQESRTRYAEPIKEINETVQAILESCSLDTGRGLIRLRCSVFNLPSIERNAGVKLNPVPPGTSAIVCGAGPSLARQFELLKSLSGRVLIVAVGHAVPRLWRAGIRPDVVAEGDPHAFMNWPADAGGTGFLVATPEVSPEVARRFEAVLWCAGSSMPFTTVMTRWGFELPSVRLHKTVTVLALEFAALLGCSRVALVGQDLCVDEAGLSHVDDNRVGDRDSLIEAPGNEGRTVLTTRDLAGLRDALEQYLRLLKKEAVNSAVPAPDIWNCTEGGAVIQGTVRRSLTDFAQALDPAASAPPPAALGAQPLRAGVFFRRDASATAMAGRLDDVAVRLKEYGAGVETLVLECKRLRKELETHPISMERVRRRQDALNESLGQEERRRADDALAPWVAPLLEFTDHIMKETPGCLSQDPDPVVQLNYLQQRFAFAGDLCADLRGDLDWARARLPNAENPGLAGLNADVSGVVPTLREVGTKTERHPYEFKSFRRQALNVIRPGNRLLADWLERYSGDIPPRFHIHWLNQFVPYVTVQIRENVWKPLSGFLSIVEDAQADVDRFVVGSGFDPARHAVVVVAPGNWIHAIEFARRYPRAEMLVAEPWPELLAVLMSRGCFLHHFPSGVLVVGAHEALKGWETLYADRLQSWKRRNLDPKFFVHPFAAEIPEIQEFARQLPPVV